MSAVTGKNVLITFGRSFLTLETARLLGAAGHRVFIADSLRLTVSRFSRYVERSFRVHRPKFEPVQWAQDLARIVRENDIDMVITVHEETDILAQVVHAYPDLFPDSCTLFLNGFRPEVRLHNKYDFQVMLDELEIPTMRYRLVRSQADLDAIDFDFTYALKQVYSRGAQQVYKVRPGQPPRGLSFDPDNPWIAQEWIHGTNYCSYSICHEGKVHAHALYPVRYAIDGHSCLTFEPVEHEGIRRWVEELVARIGYTGQIAFDFVDAGDQGLYTIECNPRATSGVMLFGDENHVDRAFFGLNDEPITPTPGIRKMIGPGMLMYGWRKSSLPGNNLRTYFKDLRGTDEVITRRDDIRPALAVPVVLSAIASQSIKYRVNLPEGFMHDHTWDGRPLT